MTTTQTDREAAGIEAFEDTCRQYDWEPDWAGLTPRLREDWRRVAAGEPLTAGGFHWR